MRSIDETCAALDALKATLTTTKTEVERKAITSAVFKAITSKPKKSAKPNGNGHNQRKAAK